MELADRESKESLEAHLRIKVSTALVPLNKLLKAFPEGRTATVG